MKRLIVVLALASLTFSCSLPYYYSVAKEFEETHDISWQEFAEMDFWESQLYLFYHDLRPTIIGKEWEEYKRYRLTEDVDYAKEDGAHTIYTVEVEYIEDGDGYYYRTNEGIVAKANQQNIATFFIDYYVNQGGMIVNAKAGVHRY